MDRQPLSRDAILGGTLATERRASRVVSTIEARVTHMRTETRRAVEALFVGRELQFSRTFGDDYLRSLKLSATLVDTPGIEDIERFARQWKPLVPPEADVRSEAIRLLAGRYGANQHRHPETFAALGFQDAAVRAGVGAGAEDAIGAGPASDGASRSAGVSQDEDSEESILRNAERALEWVSVPAGTELIRQGDEPDFLYFVISGRFRVFLGAGDERRAVADLGRGELAGEIGVLTGERRTADVVAMRDSEVVRLPQDAVLQMAHHSPRMLLRVNQVLARRLRLELAHQQQRPAAQLTIGVIGSAPGYSPKPFAEKLAVSLRPLGSVLHVTREMVERTIPRLRTTDDPSQDAELLAWLSEQEARHRYVLFEADERTSPWTDLCMRQADRVAIVADAGGPSAPGMVEDRLQQVNGSARRELILVHPEQTARPRGTAAWLKQRDVTAHHHVKLNDRELIDRCARRLAGRSVGLVLGGGGVRGYAHIGAWRAFEEARVAVDAIGGTSVGAIMAAGMATGRDAEQMADLGRVFARSRIMDLTLPIVSFFSSRAITKLLQEHTAGVRIEDLWRPFFCISTSLSTAEPVVHRDGPLWKAVRASCAIPGVFAPVTSEAGEILVDGAIMNNVPVDVMRAHCESGPVFAVNLSAPAEKEDPHSFGPWVSGWRVAWSRVNPFARTVRAPSILTTMLRTTEAGSIHRMRTSEVLSMADLVITPDVERFRRLDFRNYKALEELGYEASRAAIAGWLKTQAAAVDEDRTRQYA
ncbi:MAG: patatin-like phospholipase family protein [Dehalococcoidia bacterium]